MLSSPSHRPNPEASHTTSERPEAAWRQGAHSTAHMAQTGTCRAERTRAEAQGKGWCEEVVMAAKETFKSPWRGAGHGGVHSTREAEAGGLPQVLG